MGNRREIPRRDLPGDLVEHRGLGAERPQQTARDHQTQPDRQRDRRQADADHDAAQPFGARLRLLQGPLGQLGADARVHLHGLDQRIEQRLALGIDLLVGRLALPVRRQLDDAQRDRTIGALDTPDVPAELPRPVRDTRRGQSGFQFGEAGLDFLMGPFGFRLFKHPLLVRRRQHQIARSDGAAVNGRPDPVDQHHTGIHAIDKSGKPLIGAIQRKDGKTRKCHDDCRQQTETGEQLGFDRHAMQIHTFPLITL